MTALYKEGRNQETCKMIRDHKDQHPGGLDKPANRGVVFLLLRVFLLSKRRWKNREYLSLFVIGYSSDGFKFIFFYPIELSSKKQ